MATENAPDATQRSSYRAVFFDRQDEVFTAVRCKATGFSKKGADRQLIAADGADQQPTWKCEEGIPKVSHVSQLSAPRCNRR